MHPVAWALNFDAELELASVGPYAPTKEMIARMRELATSVPDLVRPGDVVVDVAAPSSGSARGLPGVAWCPTPRAIAALERSGAIPVPSPSLDVLRRANDRAFAASLGQTLPGAALARTFAEVEAIVLARTSGDWLLKRAFGFAGRGRRKVAGGPISEADRRWIEASLRDGRALQVEPFVTRLADFALHGFLREDGTLLAGEPTLQRCDEFGAWLSTSLATSSDLDDGERGELDRSLRESARALHELGWFGPFGVDAFRFVDHAGGRKFQPRSEINARLSMGWSIGMRGARPWVDTRGGV